MNPMYFECTIKYDKIQENGIIKKISEHYLVRALSFADAETRFVKEMTPYISGDYEVTAIRRLAVAEVFESSDATANRWYKAKLAYITLDEITGKEKRSPALVYVCATDFDDARNTIQKGMEGTLGDWEKAVISETPVIDLFK